MVDETTIRNRYEALGPLNERQRRLFAAVEARAAGYGGVSSVARALGISRETISRGLRELDVQETSPRKSRRQGGGSKPLALTDPTLLEDLKRLLEPAVVGSFPRQMWWVTKSHVEIAAALREMGHRISTGPIPGLLDLLEYRRRFNHTLNEKNHHSDGNAQFEHINAQVIAFQTARQLVISVETRKELVATQHRGQQEAAADGLIGQHFGRAIPNGPADATGSARFTNVGINPDTAEFAVNAIRRWHRTMALPLHPTADRLMIVADGGLSHRSRVRLWKFALQKLADEIQFTLSVCHYPPGVSKWNSIDQRLICYITQDWGDQPPTSRSAVIDAIGSTKTQVGPTVRCELDTRIYRRGIEVSDDEMGSVNIKGEPFRPEWNYSISARASNRSK